MSQYHHLTILERERIFLLHEEGVSIRKIGNDIHRSPSTISRELRRNKEKTYSPSKADKKYASRRKNCGRHNLLKDPRIWSIVRHLFVDFQWSPEEISNRLKFEHADFSISFITIYRAIYNGIFDTEPLSHGNRGLIRSLRHRGKTRHKKNHVETRGKIRITHSIHDRPKSADDRSEFGHWEADTVAGKTGGACLVTLTDRKSRFLLAGKAPRKKAAYVSEKMIELLSSIPNEVVKTITPDRGKEFSNHFAVTEALNNVPFYFPDPHAPWQRGTNENTNGLIREYLPKSKEMDTVDDTTIYRMVEKLNSRPRKCLGWKTPYEVFFNKVLHLI
ncbi:IS30 family transposase [Enterococcus avium]|uniref:IS30 family transposase n=1 Tax=Enterococcus avium TaxID=33945 RepID=UPI00065FC15B|nr:IS30 family transposase [Enterococcus avium]MDB1726144.1 IS30 family transposase [Enterococcus avium]